MRVYNNFPEGEYFRLKAAYEKGLKPKAGEEPEEMWSNQYCHDSYDYWHKNQLEPATEDEIFEFFEKLRLERNRKARERYHERKIEEELERRAYEASFKTAWQWLSQERRIPKEGAEAHLREKWYYADYDCWETSEWYYYQENDTRPATDWEYQKLKELYISKFGGWETIDLENTTYDGRVWWDYHILVPELEGQDDFLDSL